jgi:hypothetical protein
MYSYLFLSFHGLAGAFIPKRMEECQYSSGGNILILLASLLVATVKVFAGDPDAGIPVPRDRHQKHGLDRSGSNASPRLINRFSQAGKIPKVLDVQKNQVWPSFRQKHTGLVGIGCLTDDFHLRMLAQ